MAPRSDSFKEKMRKIALDRVNNGTHNWYKGDNVGYMAIHDWLRTKFGKADQCENTNCTYPNPKMFVYALKRGKKYKRRRSHFMMLCQSCHMKYDRFKLKI